MSKAKELALICCVIQKENLIKGTLFQSFDEVFMYAELFYKKYKDHDWQENEIDFEEAIILFVNTKKREGEWERWNQWNNIF